LHGFPSRGGPIPKFSLTREASQHIGRASLQGHDLQGSYIRGSSNVSIDGHGLTVDGDANFISLHAEQTVWLRNAFQQN
jgi:hypothetical protein